MRPSQTQTPTLLNLKLPRTPGAPTPPSACLFEDRARTYLARSSPASPARSAPGITRRAPSQDSPPNPLPFRGTPVTFTLRSQHAGRTARGAARARLTLGGHSLRVSLPLHLPSLQSGACSSSHFPPHFRSIMFAKTPMCPRVRQRRQPSPGDPQLPRNRPKREGSPAPPLPATAQTASALRTRAPLHIAARPVPDCGRRRGWGGIPGAKHPHKP